MWWIVCVFFFLLYIVCIWGFVVIYLCFFCVFCKLFLMASCREFSRGYGWANDSSSGSESFGPARGNSGHPFHSFQYPRIGPEMAFHDCMFAENQEFLSSCVYGVLMDTKELSCERLQMIIRNAWMIQGRVRVRSKFGNIYLIHFDNMQDKNYLLENGPWAVENMILHLVDWTPFSSPLAIENRKVPIWVQFWGLPLDFFCQEVAITLGNIFGDFMEYDEGRSKFSNIRFLRVKIRVDASLPLLTSALLRFGENKALWIEARYERVFRICWQCGLVGHVDRDCSWDHMHVAAAMQQHRQRIYERYGLWLVQDINYPFIHKSSSAFYRKAALRKTTKIWMYHGVYVVKDFSPFAQFNHSLSFNNPVGTFGYYSSDSDEETETENYPNGIDEVNQDQNNDVNLADNHFSDENVQEQVQNLEHSDEEDPEENVNTDVHNEASDQNDHLNRDEPVEHRGEDLTRNDSIHGYENRGVDFTNKDNAFTHSEFVLISSNDSLSSNSSKQQRSDSKETLNILVPSFESQTKEYDLKIGESGSGSKRKRRDLWDNNSDVDKDYGIWFKKHISTNASQQNRHVGKSTTALERNLNTEQRGKRKSDLIIISDEEDSPSKKRKEHYGGWKKF